MVKRLRAQFFGTVQGVGFRYTVRMISSNLSVSGYVRNLEDDSVELVAEGEEKVVQDFLVTIKERMGEFIRRTEETWSTPVGEHRGFTIRF